jgi:hypothetical protein
MSKVFITAAVVVDVDIVLDLILFTLTLLLQI